MRYQNRLFSTTLHSAIRKITHSNTRMASNKAAWLDKPDTPFRIDDAALPKPGPEEIVVRNRAIAINPVDFSQWKTGYVIQSFPTVIGNDVAGEVYEVGSSVTRFKKGDRVVGHPWGMRSGKPEDSAYALYSKMPANNAAIIPDKIAFKDAAVLPVAVDTAAAGLYKSEAFALAYPEQNAKSTGKTIIVYGASSSVGIITVQLAKASGYRVVGIAGRKNFDLVRGAGAAEVFDYKDADVVDATAKAIDQSSFYGIYDTIGDKNSHKIVVPLFEKFGNKGYYASTKALPENLPEGVTSHRVFGLGPHSFPVWQNYITPALESGSFRPLPQPEVVGNGLESIQKAVEAMGQGVSAKKLVVEL